MVFCTNDDPDPANNEAPQQTPGRRFSRATEYRQRVTGGSLEDLAGNIEQGHGVIIASMPALFG